MRRKDACLAAQFMGFLRNVRSALQYSSVTKDYLDKYRALAGSLKDPKNADLR